MCPWGLTKRENTSPECGQFYSLHRSPKMNKKKERRKPADGISLSLLLGVWRWEQAALHPRPWSQPPSHLPTRNCEPKQTLSSWSYFVQHFVLALRKVMNTEHIKPPLYRCCENICSRLRKSFSNMNSSQKLTHHLY